MVVTATSRFATKQHVVTQAQLALQPTHCVSHRAALCVSSESCDAVAYIIGPGEISANWVDSWNSSHNRGGCCHKGAQYAAATVISCMARVRARTELTVQSRCMTELNILFRGCKDGS